MKRIIRILLTLTGMVWATVGFAQTPTVTYEYDDCGNRIERTIGFKKVEENGRSLSTDDGKGWLAKVEENFGSSSISLYPNPTDGKFSLAFAEEVPPFLQAVLCTAEGSVIESRQVKNPTEEFDLTGRSAGIYVLRLTSGKETRTWKIIKKN
ncbi:MAG: T9SS type A sorting domain-containing protein [bacterium]|nr:T9SS type A sorting domain-containing protein [bacterium]